MAKVNTNISIDQNLKIESVKLFSSFGLDLSTAITLFLQQSVREQRIPFEIRINIPNETTKEALSELDEMKDKKKYKRYSNFEEILDEV
ncbi:MAG: type II toxin-antitoxin system RelB/DinJ family antitoxin [Bacilli bacterium]|nr:type II toxin-antitoxin system RelB/DinJ family antitoxin [Bacilli bacterium]